MSERQPAVAPARVSIDFRQAIDLLAMFGGQPAEISLEVVTARREGLTPGLYAWHTDYPEEGSVNLGVTEGEAAPAEEPTGQQAEPTDAMFAHIRAIDNTMDREEMRQIIEGILALASQPSEPPAPAGQQTEPTDEELQEVIERHWGYGRDNFLSVARAVLALAGQQATGQQAEGTPVDDKAHPRFLAGYDAGLHDLELEKQANPPAPAGQALLDAAQETLDFLEERYADKDGGGDWVDADAGAIADSLEKAMKRAALASQAERPAQS